MDIYVTYPTVILVVVSHFIHSTSSLILSWMSKPLVFADWIMLPPLFILYAVRICFQNIKKLKILVMLENFQSLAYVGGDSIYFCLFLCFIIFGKWGSVFFRSRFLHHWVSTAVTHLNAMEYLSPSQGVRARAQDKFLLPCLPLWESYGKKGVNQYVMSRGWGGVEVTAIDCVWMCWFCQVTTRGTDIFFILWFTQLLFNCV